MNENFHLVEKWLNLVVGQNDEGPVTVGQRISYLVVCNGGYRSAKEVSELHGTVIGPFTLGLSMSETTEHVYYVGMLAGMTVLGTDPYPIMNSFIERYVKDSLLKHNIVLKLDTDAHSLFSEDGSIDMKILLDSYDHMNPIHGGDDN